MIVFYFHDVLIFNYFATFKLGMYAYNNYLPMT